MKLSSLLAGLSIFAAKAQGGFIPSFTLCNGFSTENGMKAYSSGIDGSNQITVLPQKCAEVDSNDCTRTSEEEKQCTLWDEKIDFVTLNFLSNNTLNLQGLNNNQGWGGCLYQRKPTLFVVEAANNFTCAPTSIDDDFIENEDSTPRKTY